MSGAKSTSRKVRLVLTAANYIVPKKRIDWLQAMSSEAEYVPNRAKSTWAIGCLIAVLKMRFVDMFTLKHEVSRPVLTLEILVCFGSLVFAGIQFAKVFFQLSFPSTQLNPGALIVSGMVLGVAGILGISGGLRQVFQRKSLSKPAAILIVAASVVFAVAMFAADGQSQILRDAILLCVLPTVGAVHLRSLARNSETGVTCEV